MKWTTGGRCAAVAMSSRAKVGREVPLGLRARCRALDHLKPPVAAASTGLAGVACRASVILWSSLAPMSFQSRQRRT